MSNILIAVKFIGLALAAVVVASQPARAADGVRGEVAGGYSFLSVGTCSAQTCTAGDTSETFPAGWFASGGAAVTDWLMAVGEVGGNYKSSSDSLGDVTATASLKLYAFLGGARVLRRSGHVTVFGQFLVGAAWSSAGVAASGPGVSVDAHATETDFCYQPGGGVDIDLSRHTTMRVGANVRFIPAGGTTSKELQVVTGLVYRFGR